MKVIFSWQHSACDMILWQVGHVLSLSLVCQFCYLSGGFVWNF